ncbi:MAG: hypothetical protein H7645_03785 [Candidatus Heimdallarchaeota archaeon]|nr:hypothetical protein [Candidatus Heimdallarchaeota archaeon]MCK4769437.1 hypothetical protein [Candidatus Heimdallarchaeota archaeon]
MRFKYSIALLLIACIVGISLHSGMNESYSQYFFELTLKTNGGGVRPNYALIIADQLEEIGIKVTLKVEIWGIFVGQLVYTHDYDLLIVALSGGAEDPDSRSVYTEDGSLNIWNLTRDMPYETESEDMQELAAATMDVFDRQQLYFDWQQLLMDKIVPFVPLTVSRNYVSTWSNLQGFDQYWGLLDSLPYMEFSGLHEGQSSVDELNIHNNMWSELNPVFSDDYSSRQIISLVSEDMCPLNPGFAPFKTGLVYDWDIISDTHIKYYVRDSIYWNPSYNVTERTPSSGPLDTIPIGELMIGLKDGTYSDGTNKQVTAKDFVFSILTWGNLNIAEDPGLTEFVSDIYIDPVNDLAFHVFIDGDPDTPEIEPFANAFLNLELDILPEFFLNSTDLSVTYSGGGVPTVGLYNDIVNTPQWITYSTSAFGCGKYMLDYYVPHSITVLQKSPFWMEIGIKMGTTQDLDIQTINVRVIPDPEAALSEFKAGNLDIFDVSQFTIERRNMQMDSRFDVQSSITNYQQFMGFNVQRPFIGGLDSYIFLTETGKEEYTKGVAVRKAISYAIDKIELNNIMHEGEHFIYDSPIYPLADFWYYDGIIKYTHSLSTAWEWMEAAGYSQSMLESGITLTDPDTTETSITTETEYTTDFTTETITADPVTEITTVTVTGPPTTKTVVYPLIAIIPLVVITLFTVGLKAIQKRKK